MKRGITHSPLGLKIKVLKNHPQVAYILSMKALFVELPAFAKYRADYLDDEGFRGLQRIKGVRIKWV